ncbi:hypothetical protein A9P82_00300 [Arachidicoccus ginsenosidimutans]|uniref:GLPGLI family protein n=1 Tax=Arachidicoccus sp. BS20 TaxID=1850526 RepID=UPI0007F119BC|nr:GLPGLI family protein [Arachidicoccus sp. BS20]ANI87897.1 hypothetical protein A9P82_00300 [Arachidicoccus sp. BS20]
MKICCTIILTGLLFQFAKAQIFVRADTLGALINPQPVVGKIFYNMTWLRDTTKPDSLYHEQFELDLGKTMSCYFSYYAKERDIKTIQHLEQAMQAGKILSPPPGISIPMGIAGEGNQIIGSRDLFFTDNDNDTRMMYIWSSEFLIKDTDEKINWEILDSTKNIKGNLCQKATGESHGRTYTAWFCSDLPYSFGPRRLHGLPGLILEAYDEKREIVYTLDHIEKATSGQVGFPKRAIATTDTKFYKALDAYDKNPEAFTNPGAPAANSINSKLPSHIGNYDRKKFIPNNPIDLK